jgi:DNA repair protein RecO (recombination protein O)
VAAQLRVNLQRAHVLHGRDYRDSSRILEIFTPEYGRLSVLVRGVRGARKSAAARSAQLQPFRPLLLSFSGKADLKTLTAVEPDGALRALPGERLYSGLYMNELLVRLLHRFDPHPALYRQYHEALERLELVATPDIELVLRGFEYQLLEELGYGFDLGSDGMVGEPLRDDTWYNYHQEYGLVEQGRQRGAGAAYLGADLLALRQGEFTTRVRQAAKQLMREVLSGHLGETPLRSRSLFRRHQVDGGASPPNGEENAQR